MRHIYYMKYMKELELKMYAGGGGGVIAGFYGNRWILIERHYQTAQFNSLSNFSAL